MKKLMNMYRDFRDRVLIIYIALSILFCIYYSVVFFLIGAVLPAYYQMTGIVFLGISVALLYKEQVQAARYLSIGTSYALVFGQSYFFFGKDSGFQFLYIALLVVVFTIFKSDTRKAKQRLTAFTILLVATFLFLQEHSLLLMEKSIQHSIKDLFFNSSIIGIFMGIFVVLFSFSRELEKTKLDLQYLATVDPLTGMNNRRNFMMFLETVFKSANNGNGVFSLLMIDVDRFKSVNDAYGHIAGDLALSEIAYLIRNAVRETDYCARYGGEEFSVILPNTSEGHALVVADKIRTNIEKHFFDIGTEIKLQMTVSIGISTYNPHSTTTDSILKKADIALYRSKENGRNRCNAYFEAL